MTPENLVAMRKAATLAFAIPGMEIDIRSCEGPRDPGRLLARVQRESDAPHLHPSITILPPCAFRASVARVTASGDVHRTSFLGLPADAILRLDPFMPFSGAASAVGLVIARVGQVFVHAFATVAPDAAVHAEVADSRSRCDVGASWDPATRVHLVSAETRVGDMIAKPAIRELMESLLARLAVAEIEQAVAAPARRPGTA